MKATIGLGKATLILLIAALAATGCSGLDGTPHDPGAFSRQELDAARRIRHDAPYWLGTTAVGEIAPHDRGWD